MGNHPFTADVSPALRRRHFEVLRCWTDEHGIHVDYLVDADPSVAWAFPAMEGTDDRGAELLSQGGAMSPARDGGHDGVLTAEAPSAGAGRAELSVTWETAGDDQSARLVVDLG